MREAYLLFLLAMGLALAGCCTTKSVLSGNSNVVTGDIGSSVEVQACTPMEKEAVNNLQIVSNWYRVQWNECGKTTNPVRCRDEVHQSYWEKKSTVEQKTGNYDRSGLFIYASCPVEYEHCPVELLVTDPNGQRTGFDEGTGTILQEMPDSDYGTQPGIADAEDPSNPPLPEEKQFEALQLTSGKYTLHVIGTGIGRYTIEVVAYDFKGAASSQTITGNSAPGVTTIYQVRYSSAPGSKVKTMQAANSLSKRSSPLFAVEIALNKASLKTGFYKQTGIFFVDAKVKNISDANQQIIVWTQYGWSWISDNPEVSPGIEALKNSPSSIKLKPGQEYDGRIEMYCDPHRTEPVTFRLGFVPRVESPASTMRTEERIKDVFWSNPVTLDR